MPASGPAAATLKAVATDQILRQGVPTFTTRSLCRASSIQNVDSVSAPFAVRDGVLHVMSRTRGMSAICSG